MQYIIKNGIDKYEFTLVYNAYTEYFVSYEPWKSPHLKPFQYSGREGILCVERHIKLSIS